MMIRILLDECLPKKLKYRIEELDPDFSAKTVPAAGWAIFILEGYWRKQRMNSMFLSPVIAI
ncbi:hypothetical protein SAMN05443144_11364 [Fodinibius roseus]|uniref:DUF5615 domain-containing protein n=1 Tax=Fodinibius roseus TaxID=1194090 RepID=A0A1M5EHZ8_9BACT|nr:hypothetical protein [Fodinibius roseus]SHF78780.1 hypothetical protein SAMN05443144_11364 [Fodinibius roseus]